MGAEGQWSVEELDLAALRWRKARTSDQQGACIRIAHHAGRVLIDDSKHPSPASHRLLQLSQHEWLALLSTAKTF